MKIKKTKQVILTPLIVGAVGIVAGVGLLLYYYLYAKEASVASFVTSYAVLAVGVLALLSTIYFGINQYIKLYALKHGEDVVATYVSNETTVSSQKQNFYSLTYKYTINGVEYVKKSKSEFLWVDIITLKTVKDFNIKIYKNQIVLKDNLDELFEKNKEQVKETEKKYLEAYDEIEKIFKDKKI